MIKIIKMNGKQAPKNASTTAARQRRRKAKRTKQPIQQPSKKVVVDTAVKRIAVATPTKKAAVARIKTVQQDRTLARKATLSRESLHFFTSATDPMHDSSIKLSGWPDRNIELSVVRKVPQTAVLSYPVGNTVNFPPGGTFDIHLVLHPWLQLIDMREEIRSNNVIDYTSAASQSFIGGLQAYATQPGADFVYGSNNPTTGTAPLIGELLLDPKYSIGVGRVVGIGIEIVNTTATLYKNGQIFCWRAPEPVVHPTTWNYRTPGGAETDVFSMTAQVFRYPPANTAQAQLYTGTVDWEAMHGAYMVGTFTDFENPAQMVGYTEPILLAVDSAEDMTYVPGDNTTVNETQAWVPTPILSPTLSGVYSAPGCKLYPYNQMGMILTGLTAQSTFTMKLVVYYESFPSLAEPEILLLANPSAKYDPRVLEMLSRVMRSLPVAVPSKENAEGDWWDRVLEALQVVSPAALSLFGGEVLAPGAVAALQGLRNYRNG